MPEIICQQCGRRFTAATRRTRYCPDCKKQHRRDADRFRLGWTKDEIAAGQRKLVCISCGKEITDLRAGQGRYCPDCRRKRISASVQMSTRRAADGQPPAHTDGRTKGSAVPRLPDGRVTPLLLRPGGPFDFVGSCTAPDGSPLFRARCKACGCIIERAPGFFWSRTTVSCGCLRRTPRSDERKETLRAAFRRVRPRVCKKCRRIFFGTAHERYCPACKKHKPFLRVGTMQPAGEVWDPHRALRRPEKPRLKGGVKDITGERFGKLTAIRFARRAPDRQSIWLCQCDCGRRVEVRVYSLVSGHTRSCGCLSDPSRLLADRVNGTRIGALKPGTRSSNTSGVRGVSFNKRDGKYEAYIQLKGVRTHLGMYDTLEAAAAARREAEKKFFAPVLEAHKK